MSDEALLREDAEARARALGPGSYIVEAPAGAGKTELLAQRFLKLLATVEAPEEIVALTFTNKAAAEMRHRIMDNLAAAAAGQVPDQEHKRISHALAREALAASERHGWALLDHPGRLRVTTIDALCAAIARQMPVLSRFGSEPRVAADAGRHYEEAARRALAWLEEEGEHAPHVQAVEGALRHLDNDALRLAELLATMLSRRDQWLRHALQSQPWQDAELALGALVRADLKRAARALPERRQQALMPIARYAAGNLPEDHPVAVLRDWQRPLAVEAEELPLWRGLATLLLTDKDEPRKQLNVRIGFPPKESKPQQEALAEIIAGLDDDAIEALAETRRLPDPHYTEEEWATIEALAGLLRLAAGELWAVFNQSGEADFVEVALRARQALGDEAQPTDLALALDYRIRHLLVDEFQDTSPTQIELLERLTAGWAPGDGRTLFLVGDPMQSIYRFRKADVGLFLDVQAGGLGALPVEPLRLYRNNRSQAPVVAWVNATFARVFAGADDVASGAIRYRPSAATRHDRDDADVVAHALTVAAGDDAALAEAREIIAIIDAERAADPRGSIAVLVRARDHLATLVEELRRHRPDLHFTAVEMERLNQRQPVQDLLALTRALLHRGDRVSWLAILRAPWCGLTLADLHALAAADPLSTPWRLIDDAGRLARLSDDGRARVARFAAVIGEALRQQGRMSTRRLVEGTWLQLDGPACLAGASDLADVGAFLDLLDELEAGGRLTLAQLDKEVGELFAAPDAIDQDASDGSLQFMTLHKAKGLEFDTVILPGLNRKAGSGEAPLMRWEEVIVDGREHLVVAPLKRRHVGGDSVTPYDWLGRLERHREAHEAARVLYVGATRAIRRLHWVAAVEPNGKGEAKPPAGSLLELLWPAVRDAFQAAPMAAATAPAAQGFDFVPKLRRLAEPAGIVLPEAPSPVVPGAAGIEEDVGEPLDALVGTLVHAYLERIATDGLDAWAPERIAALRGAMETWLMQQGCGDREAAQGAERAGAMLATTLASDDGRWVLGPHADAATELALVKVSDGGTPTSIVDRTFVEAGARWIVDYKTAKPAGDPAAHAEHYRDQLERYADLFRPDGLPVRAAIFYAALGRLVAVQ